MVLTRVLEDTRVMGLGVGRLETGGHREEAARDMGRECHLQRLPGRSGGLRTPAGGQNLAATTEETFKRHVFQLF